MVKRLFTKLDAVQQQLEVFMGEIKAMMEGNTVGGGAAQGAGGAGGAES